MKHRPITFSLLVKVLAHSHAELVGSPPAPQGYMYFIGSQKGEAFFPYSSGPVHYLDREYRPEELIPVKLTNSLIKHLKLDAERFWQDAEAFASQGELIPVRTAKDKIERR